MRNALIATVFQLGWFACVLSGASQQPAAAAGAAAAVIACNLWLRRGDLVADLRLVGWVTLVGFAIETVNLLIGAFSQTAAARAPWLCPLWLLALWAMFATVLRGPLAWLSGRYRLSALLGAALALPNYYLGARLGAVTLSADSFKAAVALVAAWGFALPLLVWLADRQTRRGIGA